MHGYGRLTYFNSRTYYEGEFKNGLLHGYGKYVEYSDNYAEKVLTSKEGYWEYGSFVPENKVSEDQRQDSLKQWEKRQSDLLKQHNKIKKEEVEREA